MQSCLRSALNVDRNASCRLIRSSSDLTMAGWLKEPCSRNDTDSLYERFASSPPIRHEIQISACGSITGTTFSNSGPAKGSKSTTLKLYKSLNAVYFKSN